MTTYRKKLIEVALPLDAINKESAHEGSVPRKGHPATMHLWWARRRLAACRAVIFSSLVDDPDEPNAPKAYLQALDALAAPLKPPEEWDAMTPAQQRRERLFAFVAELVKWGNTTNEAIIGKARELINLSCEGKPPPLLDPFCGGGSIPLEGQRLGLEVYAGDLNPVAVLITKALVDIPPKFAGRPPVNPDDRAKVGADATWRGAAGLAADVRYYGKWMRDRAWERIGHLYPKGPNGETIIAWLWARTVKCPNPACGTEMPLVSSFVLSSKPGKEAYLVPETTSGRITFRVSRKWPGEVLGRSLDPKRGFKRGMSGIFECAACSTVTTRDYVAAESLAGRLGIAPMALVAEGRGRREYFDTSLTSVPSNLPEAHTSGLDAELSPNPRDVWCRNFGLNRPIDLFTPRQLVALTTFSDLVITARELALHHAREAGLPDDSRGIDSGGSGSVAYADSIAIYLAFALDKMADWGSALCSWIAPIEGIRNTFARHALPMVWDFAETNPLGTGAGNWLNHVDWVSAAITSLPQKPVNASIMLLDAASSVNGAPGCLVATDPPYYDNIGYADLSDFFYVWLRRSLGAIYPSLFATVLTPKQQEIVSVAYRFGGDQRKAERFFEEGIGKAFALMKEQSSDDFPLSVYYAFKQTEGVTEYSALAAAPGWQTMLNGLLRQSLQVVGTWPLRTEREGRTISIGTNALASSILIACRPRGEDAPIATRREFIRALREELPAKLRLLTGGVIDAVDLAQSAIGPGMAVFSRYARVLEADGTPMSVGTALSLINEALDGYLNETTESEVDTATRFCVAWYEKYGAGDGPFGEAEVLSKAKDVGIDRLERLGLLEAEHGKVRVNGVAGFRPAEDWDPRAVLSLTVWEACHRLIEALDRSVAEAGRLARRLGGTADAARDLAFRLYTVANRRGWTEEASAYNGLVASWTEIRMEAAKSAQETQAPLS